MSRSVDNPWLNRFAWLTALATLVLLSVGGLVTSHGAGMSVPDWPTTYGYNMFFFPISKWVGGIFWEHIHRLVASGVGFLTVILAVWLWVKEPRARVRWWGVVAVFAVVLQGVLGGLRVVLYKDQIGIFHAGLAQIFLVLVCALALITSRWWRNLNLAFPPAPDPGLRSLLLIGTLLVFAQLVIGATMRHQHAGLAIPDFPLAYHKVWPPMDATSVAAYNQNRNDEGANPITAFQIGLQMVHRLMAVLILGAVTFSAWASRRRLGPRNPLSRLALAWLGLIFVQVLLGAFTIWSNKAADVATAHMVVGALSLVTGAMLTIISFRVLIPVRAAGLAAAEPSHPGLGTSKPASSGAK
ncbi:MAG: Cytochrome oxidase assembly [Pedosphaera sp.]|nr:Cytochrome oxidase assembly [Pedosphaera sp.]